ncbi:hypothetical protein JCM11641_007263 [Rhodosporidiobolus odoratus]
MQPSRSLVLPEPYSTRATTTSSHPQLRDLLVYAPEAGNVVNTVCYDSLCSVDLWGDRVPEYTPLRFSPSTLAYGLGFIAAGGQSSEIAVKSAASGSDWCHQYLPSSSPPSATGVRTSFGGSINNSVFISPVSGSKMPRLLVSNNDDKIAVFRVDGRVPDYQAAKRRRLKQRKNGWSVVEASWAAECGDAEYECPGRVGEEDRDDSPPVEEQPTYDAGTECRVEPLYHLDVRLKTAVNHCSVSQDGTRMIAVGDTNEVHLFDCRWSGYEPVQTFRASNDASFSTDWSDDGVTFAVASQDGFVHVYDVRNLPSSQPTPSQPSPRKLAEVKTTQSGPAGAARKVKFSPGGARLDGGLLAFTEHRNRVHIVDARTFELYQVLDVPFSSTSSPSSPLTDAYPPPLRPRPQPPPRTYRLLRPPLSRLTSTLSAASGTRTPKDEVERDELEREMRLRTERRLREEERRMRERAREERRVAMELERARRAEEDDESEEEEDDDDEDEEEEEEEVAEGEEEAEDYDVDEDGEAAHELQVEYAELFGSGEVDMEQMDQEPGIPTLSASGRQQGEDDDSSSAESSVNTTRPRRFDRHSIATTRPQDSRPGVSPTRPEAALPAVLGQPESASLFPPTIVAPTIRRNFSGYSPLHPSAPRSTVPSYASPTTFSSNTTRGGPSLYYSTYLPSSFPSSFAASALHNPPSSVPSFPSIFSAPLNTTYHSTSAFFPLDSAPGDLLGLDWDEWGERVIVATGERVWEWDVDQRARRGRGDWGTR